MKESVKTYYLLCTIIIIYNYMCDYYNLLLTNCELWCNPGQYLASNFVLKLYWTKRKDIFVP